jgi:hypothetical protein
VGLLVYGYLNVEQRTSAHEKTLHGRYTRWVEQDPKRSKIYRLAWDMLLEDKYTLDEICKELHARGFRYRTGRPFVTIKKNGKRKANTNTLSRIFHNWFYAGWVVSKKAGIAPKTIRGQWEPLVTTEEFEHGLEILARRYRHRVVRRKYDYLLKGFVYVQLPSEQKPVRLTCATPNPGRPGGGTPYYCITRSNINILCETVDSQIPALLSKIQVDPKLLPSIQSSYTEEVAERLGHLRPQERLTLEAALKAIDDEEARTVRLFAVGNISEAVWDNWWKEWQDRRTVIRANMEALSRKREYHIANLDAALHIIEKVGILYSKLERDDQKSLLRYMVERVVVDPDGIIVKLELRPLFVYLKRVTDRIRKQKSGRNVVKTKTSLCAGCSTCATLCVPGGI